MKKILVFEDESGVSDAIVNTFREQHDITVVNNLLELHGCLFKNPGVENYDYIWIDLAIKHMAGVPESVLKKKITELYIEEIKNYDGISLLGLDYFTRIIWNDKRFEKVRTTKFILITGHKTLLDKYNLVDEYMKEGLRVIEKRGDGAYAELMDILG